MLTQTSLAELFGETEKLIEIACSDAIAETKAKVLEKKQESFQTGGPNSWDERVFPANKPKYRSRKGNKPPLTNTGELGESIHESPDPNDIGVEFSSDHEEWARYYIDRKGGNHPFDELSDREMEKALDFLVDSIVRNIKNVL